MHMTVNDLKWEVKHILYLKHTIWDTNKGGVSAIRMPEEFLKLWVVYCVPRFYYEIETTAYDLIPD